jgi:hypothetical protein
MGKWFANAFGTPYASMIALVPGSAKLALQQLPCGIAGLF